MAAMCIYGAGAMCVSMVQVPCVCIYGVQVPCAGCCHAESTTVLDTESQRALETVQRAADNIIKQKDEIIE